MSRYAQTLTTAVSELNLKRFWRPDSFFKCRLALFVPMELQSTAQLECSIFYLFSVVRAIRIPVAINGWGGNPQINSNNLSRWLKFGTVRSALNSV